VKYIPEPLGELRRQFATMPYKAPGSYPACGCWYHAPLRSRARSDQPRPLGVGPFGVRPGRSRYREHIEPDLFVGRQPGGFAPRNVQPMPKPDKDAVERFIRYTRALCVSLDIRRVVKTLRVPRQRLGTKGEYREELVAQAWVEYCADPGRDLVKIVRKAQRQLDKQYRELTVPSTK